MQTSFTATSDTQSPSLELGDRAAADGAWVKAIQVWTSLLDMPAQRSAAQERLRWFLAEGAAHPGAGTSVVTARLGSGALLLAAVACGLFGTALVLIGENLTGTSRNLLSTGAWLLYIATAALVISYAYRVGKPGVAVAEDLSDADLQHARELALRVQSTIHPTPPTN